MIKFNDDVKVYLGAIKAAKYSTSNAQDDILVERSSDDDEYSDEAFEVECESSNEDDRESDNDIEHRTLSESGCSDGEYEDDSEFVPSDEDGVKDKDIKVLRLVFSFSHIYIHYCGIGYYKEYEIMQ